jgi:hypothetical protein
MFAQALVGCVWISLVIAATAATEPAQATPEASSLVQELATFPAYMGGAIARGDGSLSDEDERREAIFVRLRELSEGAIPALRSGLTSSPFSHNW